MFNPQRRSKVSDIYMQQKSFQMHLEKMTKILKSSSPKSKRYEEEEQQQKYLNRLQLSKKEVQERKINDVRKENHRLFEKLIETERREEQNPQRQLSKKHFNSYFSSKKNIERIRNDNFTMITRMINQSSIVPNLDEMKKDFKASRKFAKMVRKLPAIIKHETEFKRKFSQKRMFESSKSSTSNSRNRNQPESKANLRQIQSALLGNDGLNNSRTSSKRSKA